MTDDVFINVCNESESMLQASKRLNMSFSSFKRKAVKLNCYITNQNWRKGKNSLTDSRIKSKYIDCIFSEKSTANRHYVKSLIIKNKIIEYRCKECGLGEYWNGKFINLQLDHINGIRCDNRVDNLRFLCPNCHSQTSTFCSKNIVSINFNNIDIDVIKTTISESSSISEIIQKLGLRDSKSNRDKISIISRGLVEKDPLS